MTRGVPQFGARSSNRDYVPRPSAYVVLRNEGGLVAVVHTPKGVFLPGGGQDLGESPERAALREVEEECGLQAELNTCLGVAEQFVDAEAEGAYFAKRSTFYRARTVGSTIVTELDHELAWLSSEEAEQRLTHSSHSWAVAQERRLEANTEQRREDLEPH